MNPTHSTRDTGSVEPTTADILRCAAGYLARHGWHQGDMFDDATRPTPAACAQGAIRMAVIGHPTTGYTTQTARQVNNAIGELGGWLAWTHLDDYAEEFTAHFHGDETVLAEVIADWNDDHERTADQVITALTEAAATWDHNAARRSP